MNPIIKDQKARKRSSLKMSNPFANPNDIIKMQSKRNSVNWCLPQGHKGKDSSVKFMEIRTNFNDLDGKEQEQILSEEKTKEIESHKKFAFERRQSSKNEYQIAKELLRKQEKELEEEEEEEKRITKKNTELNKEVGKTKEEDEEDENSISSYSDN